MDLSQRYSLTWGNSWAFVGAKLGVPETPSVQPGIACDGEQRWTTSRVRASILSTILFALMLPNPGAAFAQLRVSAIDWVQGRPEIPHPAINGKSTILQAIAEGGNCGGEYSYRWDWNGDGDFDDGDEGWRRANSGGHRAGFFAPLGLEVQFPRQPGDRLFFPKVEVDCAGSRASTTFPVLVKVERVCDGYPDNINGDCEGEENIALTRQLHHDRVVDRALWWMFNRISHYGDDGQRGGVHSCVFWGAPAQYGQGHMLNAFLRRSHGFGPGRESDPYYRHATLCGLNALVGTFEMTGGLWFDDDGARGWGGWRMQYTSGRLDRSDHWSSYGSTAWVEPIANFGNPDYRVTGGQGNVQGRNLRDLGGDLADGLVYCMGGSGQWFYSCRSDGHPDGSTNGWAPEALRLLGRKFGTNTYDWARTNQRNFLNNNCSHNSNDDHRLFGCDYHTENRAGGYGKLAGNALVGYGWTQNQNFTDNTGDATWRMREHWRAASRLDHPFWGLYYMYATTKGMRSFVPEQKYFEGQRDWATEFAHFLLAASHNDQYWLWCSDENDGQCHWHWKNSFNRDTSTAISTQIVQTWLEAQAMARATPQDTGPGIAITFDHSWSHILDPGVSLTRFRWNVRNHPEDDVNGDGTVSLEEIVWDFETDDLHEVYRYEYSENLGWEDVRHFKVTLEITDSQGRTTYDDKSVQITLSLKNHPPVIIGHPTGINGFYSGYVGSPITLDPRATRDVDAEHEVFPGDDRRPRGIADRITSICYDIDLDGRWCEEGENATAGPIEFMPNADMDVGDRIGIPIRACDDGRWNGKCYQPGDGGPAELTRGDCTDCAYGSVGLELVNNVDPPVIGSATDVYEAIPGQPIQLDFSATTDPEGVLGDGSAHNGVRFVYQFPADAGRMEPTEGFPGGNDFGPRPTFIPHGDGSRDIPLTVVATDMGGVDSRAEFTIRLANEPPTLDQWNVRFLPRPPIIADELDIQNLGNRRYRVRVDAVPDPGWDAYLDYQTTEQYNEPVQITADLDGDGIVDLRSDQGDGTLGPYTLTEGGVEESMTVTVSDGEDTVIDQLNVAVPPIPEAVRQEMRFSVDIGDDGAFEMAGSANDWVEFLAPRGASEMRFSGRVTGNGFDVPFDAGVVTLPNGLPRLQSVRVASVDGFNVVLVASAVDDDGDPLSFTINWGDGTPSVPTNNAISQHSYPRGEYGTYTITVTTQDGRGGAASRQTQVTIEEPVILRAELRGLSWRKITEVEGRYDGVKGLAISPDGTVFIHNYLDEIRRLRDDGENWDTVLADVECCGSLATRRAGELLVASPDGLYYTNDNGDNWVLWDEQKFVSVMVAPSGDYALAGTLNQIRRYDFTGRLTDTHELTQALADMEACTSGDRAAYTTAGGFLYVNDSPDLDPDEWRVPEARFSKGRSDSSVSFDDQCNVYQGFWNGYRVWTYPEGPAIPSGTKKPKHMIHPAGYYPTTVHRGSAMINDILAFPEGPFVVATDRGIFGSESQHNAYRAPFWKPYNHGISRSNHGRKLAMSPTSGHLFLATSASARVPKYCRKANSRRRRNVSRRRRRTGRQQQFQYVFCGFVDQFYGGLYRSSEPLLNMRKFGEGGAEFTPLNGRGVMISDEEGGLVVDVRDERTTHLWLPDTENSQLTRWDTSGEDPRIIGAYRVGLPAGECPNTCCWQDGCNMPSRVAVDDRGDAYVASIGFGMQGTVTKIASRLADCLDRNGDGEIQTSIGDVALDYGSDECILWTAAVGGEDAQLRAMVIDAGTEDHPHGTLWVGAYQDARMYQLDPTNGQTMRTVDLDVDPFGAVLAGQHMLWVSTLGEGRLQSIDLRTYQAGPVVENPTELRNGCRNSYASTVDREGRIWMSGWECGDVIAYDPRVDDWCRIAIRDGRTAGRGITVDHQDRVWAALGGDGQSGVAWWDSAECVVGETYDAVHYRDSAPNTRGASAIGADQDGHIWMAHYISPSMVKFDTIGIVSVDQWDGGRRVYNFSDMTGLVRRNSIGQGRYAEDIEAACDEPTWATLSWNADIPDGAEIRFIAYSANRRHKLDEATPVLVASSNDDESVNMDARLVAAGARPHRFIRVEAVLIRSAGGLSPVLQSFGLVWNCD